MPLNPANSNEQWSLSVVEIIKKCGAFHKEEQGIHDVEVMKQALPNLDAFRQKLGEVLQKNQ